MKIKSAAVGLAFGLFAASSAAAEEPQSIVIGGSWNNYTLFPTWYSALQNNGQCIYSSASPGAIEWGACKYDVWEAVQFDAYSSAPGPIKNWQSYCMWGDQPLPGAGFISCAHPNLSVWTQDSNSELHDTGDGYCFINNFGRPGESYCDGNNSEEHMTPVGGAAAPSSVIFGYFPVMNEQLVLDVHYDGRANGTVVDLATKNGTPAQAWSWSGVTDLFPFQGYEYFPGEIYLNDTSQGAKCLTAAGDYSGAPVYIYDCGAAPYQSWAHVYPDQWVLAGTEMCLDVPNGSLASGEPLWVWSCWGGLNQQWNSPRTGSF